MKNRFYSYRRRMFAILMVVYATEMFHRNCLNVMREPLTTALGIDAAAWGMLGGAYSYAQLAVTLPSGVVVDYMDTKKVFLAGMSAVTAGLLLFTAAPGLPGLFLGRMLVGAGETFLFPAWVKIIGFWHGKKEQDFLVGVSTCLAYAVGVLALTPLSFCLERFAWRMTFAVIIIASLAVLVLVWFYSATKPTRLGFPPVPSADMTDQSQSLSLKDMLLGMGCLLKKKSTWPPIIALLGVYGSSYALNGVWGSSFLSESYRISTTEASGYLVFTLVGTAAAAMIGPVISQKLGSRRIPMLASCLGLLLCWGTLITTAGKLSAAALRMLLLAIGLCSSPAVLGMLIIKEMHPAKYTGMAIALFSLGAVFGGALVPSIVGFVYKTLGDGLVNCQKAFCVCEVSLLVSTVCSCMTETHCKSYEMSGGKL